MGHAGAIVSGSSGTAAGEEGGPGGRGREGRQDAVRDRAAGARAARRLTPLGSREPDLRAARRSSTRARSLRRGGGGPVAFPCRPRRVAHCRCIDSQRGPAAFPGAGLSRTAVLGDGERRARSVRSSEDDDRERRAAATAAARPECRPPSSTTPRSVAAAGVRARAGGGDAGCGAASWRTRSARDGPAGAPAARRASSGTRSATASRACRSRPAVAAVLASVSAAVSGRLMPETVVQQQRRTVGGRQAQQRVEQRAVAGGTLRLARLWRTKRRARKWRQGASAYSVGGGPYPPGRVGVHGHLAASACHASRNARATARRARPRCPAEQEGLTRDEGACRA